MTRFKVGDKVIAKKGAPYRITTDGWRGTVTLIHPNGEMWVKGENFSGDLGACVDPKYFDLDTSGNQKIVITTDGKTTLARLYDGKNVVKTATAKCCPTDKFDFNLGATIALSRLTGFEKKIERKVEGLDWEAFKASKIAVKVTKDNFKVFVAMAKMQGLRFKPDADFNPFEDVADIFFRVTLPVTLKRDELYIKYKDDRLKAAYDCDDMEESVWA